MSEVPLYKTTTSLLISLFKFSSEFALLDASTVSNRCEDLFLTASNARCALEARVDARVRA